MIQDFDCYAIIGAKKHSIRFPYKNRLKIGDEYLLLRTIKEAFTITDTVYLITDDEFLIDMVKPYNVIVLDRPAGCNHIYTELYHYSDIFTKRPKCVLFDCNEIRFRHNLATEVYNLLNDDVDSVVMIKDCNEYKPEWCVYIENGLAKYCNVSPIDIPRYHVVATPQIFWSKNLLNKDILGKKIRTLKINPEDYIHIDVPLDYKLAEVMYKDVQGDTGRC